MYNHYYQMGSGNAVSSGISRVFVGPQHQRGHGIGQFLGDLFRRALPLLTRGAKAIGSEALSAGYNILTDVDQDIPVKQSFRNRARESAHNLRRKAEEKLDKMMEGGGYKNKRRLLSNHLLNTLGTVQTLGYPVNSKKKKKSGRKRKKNNTLGRVRNSKKKINNKKKKKTSRNKKKKKKIKKQSDIFS